MTITEQVRALDEAIVREVLEAARREAERQEWIGRVWTVPQDAVEAARAAKRKREERT